MGIGGCVKCKSCFNIYNTPHANEMQDSVDGEYCWNGRGVTFIVYKVDQNSLEKNKHTQPQKVRKKYLSRVSVLIL